MKYILLVLVFVSCRSDYDKRYAAKVEKEYKEFIAHLDSEQRCLIPNWRCPDSNVNGTLSGDVVVDSPQFLSISGDLPIGPGMIDSNHIMRFRVNIPAEEYIQMHKTIDSLKHIIDSLKVGNHWDVIRAPTYILHTYYKNGKKHTDTTKFNEP